MATKPTRNPFKKQSLNHGVAESVRKYSHAQLCLTRQASLEIVGDAILRLIVLLVDKAVDLEEYRSAHDALLVSAHLLDLVRLTVAQGRQ